MQAPERFRAIFRFSSSWFFADVINERLPKLMPNAFYILRFPLLFIYFLLSTTRAESFYRFALWAGYWLFTHTELQPKAYYGEVRESTCFRLLPEMMKKYKTLLGRH